MQGLGYSKNRTVLKQIIQNKGVTGFDGEQEVNGACRALGVSLNLREKHNCQRTIGSRSLIDCDVFPFFVCERGKGANLAGWSKAGAPAAADETLLG